MTLYELTGQLVELMEMAEDEEISAEAIKDTLEGLEGELEDKADGYARVIKSLESEAKALKEEEKRIANRRSVLENNAGRMKKALEEAMISTGKKNFKTLLFSFGIQKNGGKQSIVMDTEDFTKIPKKYRLTTANMEAIREALEDGRKLGFAHLAPRGEGLRIR